jgi:hypothetical protein
MVHHDDAIREVRHHLHVMLDPDDCWLDLVHDAEQEARQVLALLADQAGAGLVEQQQLRLHLVRDEHSDVDRLRPS